MRKTSPPLHALRAFEAAARLGSFAQAARELHVTPSAVSQQVAALERRLGIALFERVRQRIRPTEAGASYRLSLAAALDRIESATVDLISHGGSQHLRIGALPSLATYWLIPRLRRFARVHPSVDLQLVSLSLNFASAERSPDLEGDQVDLGVFYGDGDWPGLTSHHLMNERLVAVAAPALDGDHPTTTKRLDSLPLLQHSTRPESWSVWFRDQDTRARAPRGPSFEHFYMLVEAAKAGLGIALVPDVFVGPELQRGTLELVSNHALESQRGYYVVCESSKSTEPAVACAREWLLAEAAPSQAPRIR